MMSKVLSSKCALIFGQISYSLYLIHEPVIQYVCWLSHGPISYRYADCELLEDDNCEAEFDAAWSKRLVPGWCIPVVWIVSILIAFLLNRVVKEPLRKMLSPAR